MKLLFIILVSTYFIGGCATTAKNRTIAPTCEPYIGMSETVFVGCACIRPLLNPDGGVKLIHTLQSAYGVTKIYACSRYGGNINASFKDGILQYISSR